MPPRKSKPHISDADREKLEEALATALLLIYAGHRAQAMKALGSVAATVPDAEAQQVLDFAQQRAALIQDGINTRMADGNAQVRQDIDEYNRTVLQPYMESWAQHQGTIAGYSAVPRPDGSTAAQTQADGSPQLWQWEQNTDYQDDCTEAMDASPASLDDLMAITGSPPPVHERCQCSLNPA